MSAAQTAPTRIMPLGDSITAGDTVFGTWRSWLWEDLTHAGYSTDLVGSQFGVFGGLPTPANFDLDHEGHFGWRADQLVPFITSWATSANPDIVLIHLGTNDLLVGESIPSTIADLQQIIQLLRQVNPNVVILLAQLIQSSAPNLFITIPQLNTQIATLGPALTTPASPVVIVDQFTNFIPTLDTYDGLHPHTMGNRKIADRWLVDLGPYLGNLHLSFNQSLGAGSAVIHNLGGTPFFEYLTVFTFNPLNAGGNLGTGWFGGLHITFEEIIGQFLIASPPFYGVLDATGGSEVVLPPGMLTNLAGSTIYSVSHVVVTATATFVENSPPISLLLQ